MAYANALAVRSPGMNPDAAAVDAQGRRATEAEAATDGPSIEVVLLRRYAAGDDDAMDELVLMYQNQAFWVARHLTRNDEMALDIIQDAFVRLIRNHERFEPGRASFRAWFLQIVRNMAIDHLRKARIRPASELAEREAQAPGMPRLERDELRENIRSVIDGLPDPYRELLIWRDVEGISPQDIARMTESDYGTTRWRIHNARKLFRQEWVSRFGAELP